MFVINDNLNLPIAELYSLVQLPFDLSSFQDVCKQFSELDEDNSDDIFLRFKIKDDIALLVGVGNDDSNSNKLVVTCGVLPFIWWESFSRLDYDTEEAYILDKDYYDDLFKQSLEECIESIGKPIKTGVDYDEHKHKWAVWQGKTGLLILQQSAYDPQFGFDINIWLQPWEGSIPEPQSPFIDWLFSLQGN